MKTWSDIPEKDRIEFYNDIESRARDSEYHASENQEPHKGNFLRHAEMLRAAVSTLKRSLDKS